MGSCLSKSAPANEEKEHELTELELNEIKESFNYENMVNFLIREKAYPVLFDKNKMFGANIERAFIAFGYMNSIRESTVGWKAHIAIDDEDKDNLASGWNIVKNILIEEKLQAKVVNPTTDLYKDPMQRGKQVTIYCFASQDLDWENIFNRIEEALHDAGIRPDNFSP